MGIQTTRLNRFVHEKKLALTQAATLKGKPSPRVAVLVAQWTRAKAWTRECLDKMPEDSFRFRPVPEDNDQA